MKLIHCKACHDVVALKLNVTRRCNCEKSAGHYIDRLVVRVDGPCEVVGIENSFLTSSRERADIFKIIEPHERIKRGRL